MIDKEAAAWLARRDRGLTPAEQDSYLQWLTDNPLHSQAIARHETVLQRMMKLAPQWQPAQSSDPNPDLFAPGRRISWRTLAGGMAAAAAVAILLTVAPWRERPASSGSPASPAAAYLRVNERQVLGDGSLVELSDGSRIAVEMTPSERRVYLESGEAHFTVARDAARPFIVEAGGFIMRAVGTAFNVRLGSGSLDLLVTSGQVRLEQHPSDGLAPAAPEAEPPLVSAGERAVIDLASAQLRLSSVSPDDIREVLLWQVPRLQFYETPLADAVAEFNRHNAHQLVLGGPGLESLRIGGTFRVDNLEGFVRLLEVTVGVRAERRSADETVLVLAR